MFSNPPCGLRIGGSSFGRNLNGVVEYGEDHTAGHRYCSRSFFLAAASLTLWRPSHPVGPSDEASGVQNTETKSNRGKEDKSFLDRTTEDPVAFYTLWLTLFTGMLAAFTVWMALSTKDLRDFAEEQARDMKQSISVARDSAFAAQRSTELAEKSLVAANRPWVKVDIQIAGPIVYNVNGANITLRYILKNIGHSPAVNVGVNPRLIAPIFSSDKPGNFDPRAELHKDIEALKARPVLSFGYSLFPDEVIAQEVTVTMSNEEVKRATEIIGAIYPTIIGTVDYRMGFDDKVHQTGFIVEVRRNDAPRPSTVEKNRSAAAIWVDEGDVPAADVRLFRSIFEGGYAD